MLRPYQEADVANILGAVATAGSVGRPGLVRFAQPPSGAVGTASFSTPVRLLYVLPTGGGKTVVLAAVMAELEA